MQIKDHTFVNKTELFLMDKMLQSQNTLSEGKIDSVSTKNIILIYLNLVLTES